MKKIFTFLMKSLYYIINFLHLDIFIYNLFFQYIPIKIFSYFSSSYSGYLKNYIPKRGDIVIEGGPYKGNFTILLSRLVGTTGKVFAIEANIKAFNILTKRLKKLKISNVIILNNGLWNKETKMSVPISEITKNKGFSIAEKTTSNDKNLIIYNTTIDQLVKKYNLNRVNYISMDIEGAEIEALKGAKNTLRKSKPNIAIASYHYRNGQQTFHFIEKYLRKLGYKSYTDNPIHLTTYGIPQI